MGSSSCESLPISSPCPRFTSRFSTAPRLDDELEDYAQSCCRYTVLIEQQSAAIRGRPDELEVLAAHAIVAEENNNIKVLHEPCLEELQKMLKYYGDLCELGNEPRTLIELS